MLEGLVALALKVQTFLRGLRVMSTLVLMCLTLALSPVVARILLWICWRQSVASDVNIRKTWRETGPSPDLC